MPKERLQKVMAHAGIASRRACEEIIAAGRVQVNDRVVTEMGIRVDPQRDRITVDGEVLVIRRQPSRVYLMLYKPRGYLSVFGDERGRPGLEALVKGKERLYPVGRLDLDSEGLMLLCNDGELAQRITHPSYGHRRSYLVLVSRRPGTDAISRLRRGVQLEDGLTPPSEWRVLDRAPGVVPEEEAPPAGSAWLHVSLGEGRKRQIRRMAAAEHLRVLRLIRVRLGPLALDPKLRPGDSRPLTRRELQDMLLAVRTRRRRTKDSPGGGHSSFRRRRPPSRR